MIKLAVKNVYRGRYILPNNLKFAVKPARNVCEKCFGFV